MSMAQKAKLETRVEVLEERVDELENLVDDGVTRTPETDLESFVDETSPSTHAEQATTIGYYYVHETGRESFTVSDVKEGYEECRIPKPANMSDVFAAAEDKGWLMRTGNDGNNQLWTIAKVGDEAVSGGFEG